MSDIDISSLIGRELPAHILEQLNIINRVEFPLKPTVTSASSTAADIPPTEDEQINDILNHVKEMESYANDIEDSIDLLLKDMNINPINDIVADAAKQLGSLDGNITKDIFDRAMSIIDHSSLLTIGDPVLGALTGNSKLEGEWLDCATFVSSKEHIKVPTEKEYNENTVITEKTSEVYTDFKKKQENIMLEILQMLFWNMLWAKYIVDTTLAILKLITKPIDIIILFLSKFPFKRPSEQDINKKGPIRKIINKLRIFLLCDVPIKIFNYSRYKPMVNIDCKYIINCKKIVQFGGNNSAFDISENGDIGICPDESDLNGHEVFDNNPTGLGISPQCIESAKIVMDAVLSDALTPQDYSNGV